MRIGNYLKTMFLNFWNKPLGKITINVVGGTILLFIALVINHFINPPANPKAPSEQQYASPKPSEQIQPLSKPSINRQTSATKQSSQKPHINAPNSVISINQQGGITAGTVINNYEAEKKPRKLSDEEKDKFIKALEGEPRGQVLVMYRSGDEEAKAFAIQIRDLLWKAKYTTNNGNLGWFMNDEPYKGIGLRIGSVESQPKYAGALQRAFKSIGIEPLIQLGAFDENVVDVKIGSKP